MAEQLSVTSWRICEQMSKSYYYDKRLNVKLALFMYKVILIIFLSTKNLTVALS